MKTRIIQDEPEPSRSRPPPRRRAPRHRPTSPAAWAAGARALEDRHLRLARVRHRSSFASARRSARSRSTTRRRASASRAGPTRSSTPASSSPPTESVLVQSETLTVDDPGFRAAVDDVVARARASSTSRTSARRSTRRNADQVSEDGRTVLIDFQIRGEPDEARRQDRPDRRRGRRVQEAHPDLFVGEFGVASAEKAVDAAVHRRSEEGRDPLHPRSR